MTQPGQGWGAAAPLPPVATLMVMTANLLDCSKENYLYAAHFQTTDNVEIMTIIPCTSNGIISQSCRSNGHRKTAPPRKTCGCAVWALGAPTKNLCKCKSWQNSTMIGPYCKHIITARTTIAPTVWSCIHKGTWDVGLRVRFNQCR